MTRERGIFMLRRFLLVSFDNLRGESDANP